MKLLFDFLPIILFFVVFKAKDIYWATATAIAVSVLLVLWALIRRRKVDFQLWLSLFLVTVFGGLTIVLRNPLFIMWKPSVLYLSMGATLLFGTLVLKKNLLRLMLGDQLSIPDSVWRGLNTAWVVFFVFLAGLNLAVVYSLAAVYPADRAAAMKKGRSDILEVSMKRQPRNIAPLSRELGKPEYPAVVKNGVILVPVAALGSSASNIREESTIPLVKILSPLSEKYKLRESDLSVRKNAILSIWVSFKLFGVLGLTLLFAVLQAVALARYVQQPQSPKPVGPPEAPAN